VQNDNYVIRGGSGGRERLRILSRIMYPSTISLLDRFQFTDGQRCLDIGCGGGDVTVEFARRVGPQGRAVGADIDEPQLDIARREAQEQGVRNAEFRFFDIRSNDKGIGSDFDFVYARFLLTHLSDPPHAVCTFFQCLRPGGFVLLEDVDFNGYFTYPESKEFQRYHELYCKVVRKRGGDPNIGPRLPILLEDAGFETVGTNIVQPIGTQGEVKLLNPITMESIADTVIGDGIASRDEIDALIEELRSFARNPRTVAGVPRIVQAWGRRPDNG
jgi:SAM-dependent methyltransferase